MVPPALTRRRHGLAVLAVLASACGGAGVPTTPEAPFEPPTRLGSWSTAATLPQPVSHAAAAAYQGRLWVLGGRGADESVPLATAYRYDPTVDRWERMPDLPEPVYQPTAAVLDSTLLVIGGNLSTLGLAPRTGVWAWDPVGGVWSLHSALPIASSSPLAIRTTRGVLVTGLGAAFSPPGDSTAFIPGGQAAWAYHTPAPFPPTALASEGIAAWAIGTVSYSLYDPATRSWTSPILLPATGFLLAAWEMERRLHLAIRLGTSVDHLYLDPETGGWQSGAAVPGSGQRSSAMTAVLDGKAYVLGGWAPAVGALDRVDVFDPS